MMKNLVPAIVCAVGMVLSMVIVTSVPSPAAAYSKTSNTGFYIYNDSQFTPANGVSGGSGTAIDPYIIEDWYIYVTPIGTCIEIVNTRAHFVIRNCGLEGDAFSVGPDLIEFSNVQNGTVEHIDGYGMSAGSGVVARDSSFLTIRNNTLHSNGYGVYLVGSHNISVSENELYANRYAGVSLATSWNIGLSDNSIHGNNDPNSYGGEGIMLGDSTNILITGNNVTGNTGVGLWESYCNGTTVSDNRFSSNGLYRSGAPYTRNTTGVYLHRSLNAALSGNTFIEEGVYIYHEDPAEYRTIQLDTTNTVNGDPLRYYRDSTAVRCEGIPTGQLIIINCTDVKISDVTMNAASVGIMIKHAANVEIKDSVVMNNRFNGLELWNSTNLTVRNCDLTSNGIQLISSKFAGLNVTDCHINGSNGLLMIDGTYANLTGNVFSYSSGRYFAGISLERVDHIMVSGNTISDRLYGVFCNTCTDVILRGNELSFNDDGAFISSCSKLLVTLNNFTSNGRGLFVGDTTDGLVFLNNFVRVYDQAYGATNTNVRWNESYPDGGNYWSDYDGGDGHMGPFQDIPGADGIGDTPFTKYSGVTDYYPQMRQLNVPNAEPVAFFIADPTIGNNTTIFHFNASGTWDREDPISAIQVRWDFDGDGNWETDWILDKNASSHYPVGGTYNVTLEVNDTGGLTNTTFVQILVQNEPPEYLNFKLTAYGPPMDPPWVFANETVPFEIVMTDPEHDPLGVIWDFGDGTPKVWHNVTDYVNGNVSCFENHTYAYTAAGYRMVYVNFTDHQGGGGNHNVMFQIQIRVMIDSTPPHPNAGENQSVAPGSTVDFNATGSTDDWTIKNYTWNFTYNGVSVTLWGPTPSFEFLVPGTYVVTLNATDHVGNYNTTTVTIEVQGVVPEFGLFAPVLLVMIGMAVIVSWRRPRNPGIPPEGQ